MTNRTRVAVVVFADVECSDGSNLDVLDASMFVKRVLRKELGHFDGRSHTVEMANGTEFAVRLHEAMEVGMAAGNGYLWTETTSKAFRQYAWQEGTEEASAFPAAVPGTGEQP